MRHYSPESSTTTTSRSSRSFFFTPPTTTEIYTLSLHDALPILTNHCDRALRKTSHRRKPSRMNGGPRRSSGLVSSDRKSTRLNSSHGSISYAVFCLKKKRTKLDGHVIRRT